MRTVIRNMLKNDVSIEVVGTASNGLEALEKIKTLDPDIITLDIEMPIMNGIEVLKTLKTFKKRPKVLMLSAMTSKDAQITSEAIHLGADDFMLKPTDIRNISDELVNKINHLFLLPSGVVQKKVPSVTSHADRVVLVGASAGGPPMLDKLLAALPGDLPAGVIITQHMPVGFTAPLAERFNRISPLPVKESENGDMIETGSVLVSKAGFHTLVSSVLEGIGIRTGQIIHASSPPVHGVRPAIDKTFESAAQVYGKNVVSVILSGMGNDGGEGAYAVKQAGGVSLLCDEKDCLVYGMARSALQKSAVDKVLPLDKLAEEIENIVLMMEGTRV
jgi:two-component system chemotaxis response regulator CheB